MEEVKTWRELLGRLTLNSQERVRIAKGIGVNQITITRWISGKSNPRQDNIKPLLEIFPTYAQLFQELLIREFPDFFKLDILPSERAEMTISSSFYSQFFQAYTTCSLQQRSTILLDAILTQLLNQIDFQQTGLLAIVCCCVQPEPGKQVRSLRKYRERGTALWDKQSTTSPQFFGVESQEGCAIIDRHPIMIRSAIEKSRLFPQHVQEQENSSITYPILLSDQIVGTLKIISTQENYFPQSLQDIIQTYIHLLTLCFERTDFYPLAQVELIVMPSLAEQEPILLGFQRRVLQKMREYSQQNQTLIRTQAELIVWREIEEELSSIAY